MGLTLSGYIARHYLMSFLGMLALLLLVTYLFDAIELLRRAANRADVPLGAVIEMSVLKLPEVGQRLLPFSVLFSAMYCFWRLTRSHELVIVRASGISAWQFLAPVLLVSSLIGLVSVTVVNPAAALMLARFEELEDRYLEGQSSTVEVLAEGGLWLRQDHAELMTLIHSPSVAADSWRLNDVQVFFLNRGDFSTVLRRIDAETAELGQGHWQLTKAWINDGGQALPVFTENYALETDLTAEKIEDSFASPETLSFWYLPQFIEVMEETGLSATRLRLHFQSLLAQPLFYLGLVLLAASVSLQPPRQGRSFMMIGTGVLMGFGIFILNDVIRALGLSEAIPVALAAWTPAGVVLLLGAAALLHLEDG